MTHSLIQPTIARTVSEGDAVALSYAQEQLCFLQKLEPGLTAYNLPRVFRLAGRLDAGALERAFQALIARHSVLRTRFFEQDGVPMQSMQADAPFAVERIDLSSLDVEAQKAPLDEAVRRTAGHVFDLGVAPAMVACLVKLGDERHVLAVCLHHIVSDAWSNPILARDLAEAYRLALHSAGPVRLPPLAVQYADYAVWQRANVEGGALERQLAHWNRHLGPEVPVLDLPTDRARPSRKSFAGTALGFDVPPALALAVQKFCRAEKCTPFVALFAAWQVLLARSSGQNDFAVGVPNAGRQHEEVSELLGFFVTTQVFRARLSPRQSLREICRQVRADALAALDNAELPFEVLLASRTDRRDPARSPLFQVMFGVQMAGETVAFDLEGVRAEIEEFDDAGAKFDLSLDFYVDARGVRGRLEYNTDLFEESTAQRLVARYLRVLEALATEPDSVLANLVLTSEGEQAQLMRQSENLPHRACADPVHRLIGQQARRTPEAVALVFGHVSLSYAQLEARANRLAHRLIALGVRPDTKVGIATERSVEMVVGLLAILKAGGAYVPIDPEYPQDRIIYMLEDSGVSLLLTQSHIARAIPVREDVQTIELDLLDLETGPSVDPDVPLHSEHLAYVIYTSGSTGRPKGAANRHRSLYNRLAWMQDAYSLDETDTVLQKTPFSFDVSVWEFFWPLMQGARLVVAQPGDHREPGRLVELIRRHCVTTIHFVPSMLQAFVAHEGIEACTSLKRIVCSGEALPAEAQARVFERLPGAGLYNLYGPTEAAIDVTHWTCQADGRNHVAIGRPIAGTKTYVLDAGLNLVPQGVGGELYLGGIGLARGYLDKSALTSERFVADPFGDTGERLYRTGDLVRWREDGQLEYLGRIDHQVKIRGFRIELGEIEAQLLAQPEVHEAVVIADDGPGGARLVGYVSLKSSQPLEPAALKTRLATVLPDYMIPSALVMLDALPLNANGKIDRKALPKPEWGATGAYEVPAEGVEQVLAGIWAAVLRVASVGRHDNFFELGGDSILSLQIVSRLRAAGWKLTPRQMFDQQTIAELAEVAEPEDAVTAQAGVGGTVEGMVPLLPFQAEFFETGMPRRNHWNQALLLHSREPLDLPALESALVAVMEHHDAFRLRFGQDADGAWRQACEPLPENWHQGLLWVSQSKDAAGVEALCDEAQRSLDLEQGPLLRPLAIKLADGSWRLLLAIHHLVIDGVSWRILLEDLGHAYARLRAGEPVVLPAKTGSVKDWALALQAHAAAHGDEELAFWRTLTRASAELPCEHPEGANTQAERVSVELRLDRARTHALLKKVPAAYRTQVNDVLLTALGRALCAWSGHERLLVMLEGHGREDLLPAGVDLSRTTGWFTSLFPVLLDPSGSPVDALKRIKESLRNIPAKGLGHGALKHLGSEAQRQVLRALPSPQLVFNYLGQVDSGFDAQAPWRLADENPGAAIHEAAPLMHEFIVNGQVLEGELSLTVSYSHARHERQTVQAWVRRFEEELDALIAHCAAGARGVTPSDFPLAGLGQAELDALPVPVAALEDLYPLSPMQQGMLFHGLLEPHDGSYVNQLAVDVEHLDPMRLRAAWDAALQRSAILRSGFLVHGDTPLQWVAASAAMPWIEQDLRDSADPDAALEALAREQQAQGFDLARPPLMRMLLARIGKRRHRLIWTHHHLLLDGWSAAQLMAEVLRRYDGQPPVPTPGRYRDYIAWMAARDPQAGERYWRTVMGTLEAPTRLFSALRPPVQPGTGKARHRSALDVSGTARLQHVARRERVTFNTLMQAGWALLLGRHTGQDTVVFGATAATRPAELRGAEQMLGLFINTLPVVVPLRPGQRVGEWLRALQASQVAAREHEHTPLHEIQAWAGGAGQGLFDSLLVFENYPVDQVLRESAPGGLVFSAVRTQADTSYPLSLLIHQGNTLELDWLYAQELCDEAVIVRLAAQLQALLLALAEDSEKPLAQLTLADAREQALLARFERGDFAANAPEPVHRLVERQARATPDAPALVVGERQLSHAELDRLANRWAHRLIRLGVRPEDRVAIAVDRSVETVVGLLAVLKAGAAYVPLDPAFPAERLAYMVEDSGVAWVLTRDALAQRMPSRPGVRLLSFDAADVSDEAEDAPMVPIHGDHLAYVLYTSGSTGRPKGVAMRHGAVARLIAWQLASAPAARRTLLYASPCFDVAFQEMISGLASGGCLVQSAEAQRLDLVELETLMREQAVERVFLTFSVLQHLAESSLAQDTRLPALREIITAGEQLKLTPALIAWLQREPQCRLLNQYGPTETHVVSEFGVELAGGEGLPPIGRPASSARLLVLDSCLRKATVGVAGELYVGDEVLARGYLNRAGLTAQRFIADPFEEGGGRLYRTGDLVRWREDGQLEYLGRLDHQVKVRGFRIELGEIEAQLLARPGVREAVVVAQEGPSGARLVGYVCGHEGRVALEASALREQLGAVLPEYMVPAAIVVLDALPLNANGKVDRKALPEPGYAAAQDYEAPQGEVEQALAQVWAQVLGLPQVGRHDNFFELGGHSLAALRLRQLVKARLDVDLPLQRYFECPSLAACAQVVAAEGRAQAAQDGSELDRMDALLESLGA
ncbi:amino acid adenylation domain-containing protein [Variovorax sp. AB1(2024)]|uniref:amino acid adenylation domain-containing protein n=1 Tax=Variovorax sp. AB1(2024) TaxID=3132214 RepID=UPI0030AD796C